VRGTSRAPAAVRPSYIALNARELIPFVGIDDQSPLPIMSAVADGYFLI
jgi:hypothetical protein